MRCNGHCDDPPTRFFREIFHGDGPGRPIRQDSLWAFCEDCVKSRNMSDCQEISEDEALVHEIMDG